MSYTDRELADGVVRGDEDAFALLFDRYERELRDHVRRIVRDSSAADDLSQEVFLRLWKRAEQWAGQGTIHPWLKRIATNLSLNYLRSLKRRREQPFEPPAPLNDEEDENLVPAWMVDTVSLGPDEMLERTEQKRLLQRFISELSEEKQEVFRLVHDAQLETSEVAERLGIPEGTVKSRMHHARRQIARDWRELASEWEES